MKRILLGVIICFLFSGCGNIKSQKESAIKINGVGFSAEDFKIAFENSPFVTKDEKGKQDFLQRFISRKLILREAEKRGLDKEPGFLQDVQFFWEQSLLKRMYSLKNKESAVAVEVTDTKIQDFYQNNREYFGDKELGEVYGQIKWALERQEQTDAISDWIKQLRRDANVDVDYEKLGIDKPEN